MLHYVYCEYTPQHTLLFTMLENEGDLADKVLDKLRVVLLLNGRVEAAHKLLASFTVILILESQRRSRGTIGKEG